MLESVELVCFDWNATGGAGIDDGASACACAVPVAVASVVAVAVVVVVAVGTNEVGVACGVAAVVVVAVVRGATEISSISPTGSKNSSSSLEEDDIMYAE